MREKEGEFRTGGQVEVEGEEAYESQQHTQYDSYKPTEQQGSEALVCGRFSSTVVRLARVEAGGSTRAKPSTSSGNRMHRSEAHARTRSNSGTPPTEQLEEESRQAGTAGAGPLSGSRPQCTSGTRTGMTLKGATVTDPPLLRSQLHAAITLASPSRSCAIAGGATRHPPCRWSAPRGRGSSANLESRRTVRLRRVAQTSGWQRLQLRLNFRASESDSKWIHMYVRRRPPAPRSPTRNQRRNSVTPLRPSPSRGVRCMYVCRRPPAPRSQTRNQTVTCRLNIGVAPPSPSPSRGARCLRACVSRAGA
eukprot:3404999-Rhodomonas_salina.2